MMGAQCTTCLMKQVYGFVTWDNNDGIVDGLGL